MTQLDLLAGPPALLRTPSWLGRDVVEEVELPFMPGDYKVLPVDDRWTVTCLITGETVYRGIGPVEVLRSPVPS